MIFCELPYQLFWITFSLMFLSLLFARKRIPEKVQEYLAMIDYLSKSAGLSRAERKTVYLELLEVVCKQAPLVIDFESLKKAHASAISKIKQHNGSNSPRDAAVA